MIQSVDDNWLTEHQATARDGHIMAFVRTADQSCWMDGWRSAPRICVLRKLASSHVLKIRHAASPTGTHQKSVTRRRYLTQHLCCVAQTTNWATNNLLYPAGIVEGRVRRPDLALLSKAANEVLLGAIVVANTTELPSFIPLSVTLLRSPCTINVTVRLICNMNAIKVAATDVVDKIVSAASRRACMNACSIALWLFKSNICKGTSKYEGMLLYRLQ